MKLLDTISSLPPVVVRTLGLITILLVAFADRLNGPTMTFSLFYLLPIAFVSWTDGLWSGLIAAALSVGLRCWADVSWWPQLSPWVHTWNTTGRLLNFSAVAWLINYLRSTYTHKLQSVEERYSRIVDTANEGILTTDADKVITFANAHAVTLLGFPAADIHGRTLDDLVLDQESRERVTALYREGSYFTKRHPLLEIRLKRCDGTPVCVLANAAAANHNGQPEMVLLFTDITARKKAEEQMRKLSLEFVRLQEDERKNFARELHDGLSQVLTTLKIMSELALKSYKTNPTVAEDQLREVIALADEAQTETKQIAYGLRPSILDDFGLNAAIPWLASRFERRTGVAIEVHLPAGDTRYDSLTETTVYRIVQELLTNIARHSGASRATIQIVERAGILALTVADNGKGLPPDIRLGNPPGQTHSGLRNVRERTEFLNGTCRTESAPGSGTEIMIELPLLHAADAAPSRRALH